MSDKLIVYERLRTVCPRKKIADFDEKGLELSVVVAFKIIGYPPKDLGDSISQALKKHTDDTLLYRFIFTVYEVDNEV